MVILYVISCRRITIYFILFSIFYLGQWQPKNKRSHSHLNYLFSPNPVWYSNKNEYSTSNLYFINMFNNIMSLFQKNKKINEKWNRVFVKYSTRFIIFGKKWHTECEKIRRWSQWANVVNVTKVYFIKERGK